MRVIYCFFVVLLVPSCSFLQIVTAKNHKIQIQSAASVIKYLKRSKLDDYPILTLDQEFLFTDIIWLEFMFDRHGNLIRPSSSATFGTCPSTDQPMVQLQDILIYGHENYLSDSVELLFTYFGTLDKMLIREKRKVYVNLNDRAGYFRTLHGDFVDVFDIYDDYVLFKLFSLGGKSKLTRIAMKEDIQAIEELNLNSPRKIQVVLLCLDRFNWMSE